jgi:hypothetical protein
MIKNTNHWYFGALSLAPQTLFYSSAFIELIYNGVFNAIGVLPTS